MRTISSQWSKKEQHLVLNLVFANQTEVAAFVLNVAAHSDAVNHHADFVLEKYKHLMITITTHDAQKLTEKDYALAAFIDSLLASYE